MTVWGATLLTGLLFAIVAMVAGVIASETYPWRSHRRHTRAAWTAFGLALVFAAAGIWLSILGI